MKFSDSHEWIKVENSIGTVGISDHAQHELGDIVYVELPIKGKKVLKGCEVAVLESTKAASDVYTPVSGEIIEVNEKLKENPQIINEYPESEGWLYKIRIDDLSDLNSLFDAEAYNEMLHGRP